MKNLEFGYWFYYHDSIILASDLTRENRLPLLMPSSYRWNVRERA